MATWRRLLGFLAMTLASLVVAHNLVFLLAYGAGFEEALAHSGHDGAWGTAVAVVLSSALSLLGLGTWRLYRLGVIARSHGASEGNLQPAPSGFGGRLVRSWISLTSATALLFVIQENLERQHMGEPLPGLAVLGSGEYANAAFVIAAVALAVAFVVALFRWRRDVLIARIAAVGAQWHGPVEAMGRRQPIWVERRHASIVVHQVSGRAPPQLSAS
jgi:hypothetical protein